MDVGKLILIVVAVIMCVCVLIPALADHEEEKNELIVVVLTGQSNSVFFGDEINDPSIMDSVGLPKKNVYYYGDGSGPIHRRPDFSPINDSAFNQYCMYSMLNSDGKSWRIGSYEACIGYELSNRYNCDVYVIDTGVPGRSISYYEPENRGWEYSKFVLTDALKQIPEKYTVIKAGYIWIQGESDKTTPIQEYIDSFKVINEYYGSWGFDTCYLVQTRPESGQNSSVAQLIICEEMDNVILASTISFSKTLFLTVTLKIGVSLL